jgi:hypothetical protein
LAAFGGMLRGAHPTLSGRMDERRTIRGGGQLTLKVRTAYALRYGWPEVYQTQLQSGGACVHTPAASLSTSSPLGHGGPVYVYYVYPRPLTTERPHQGSRYIVIVIITTTTIFARPPPQRWPQQTAGNKKDGRPFITPRPNSPLWPLGQTCGCMFICAWCGK